MTLKDWGRLVLFAAGRRKLLVVGVFLLGMAGAFIVYVLKTPVYRAETSILAQRQQALPSVVRSAVPDDSPTRGAVEMIRRRDNLAVDAQAGQPPGGEQTPAPARRPGIAERPVGGLRRGSPRYPRQAPRSLDERLHHRGNHHHPARLAGPAAGVSARGGSPSELPGGPSDPGGQRHRRRHLPPHGSTGSAPRPARRGHRRSQRESVATTEPATRPAATGPPPACRTAAERGARPAAGHHRGQGTGDPGHGRVPSPTPSRAPVPARGATGRLLRGPPDRRQPAQGDRRLAR